MDEENDRKQLKERSGWTDEQINACQAGIMPLQITGKKTEQRNIEVQTRSEENGLKFHKTVREAFEHAKKDKTVWKVSFLVEGEPVRLIRSEKKDRNGKVSTNYWLYQPILPPRIEKLLNRSKAIH